MEAARRADEIPALIEAVGWPGSKFLRNARLLDCKGFDPESASVAADIWMLLEDNASNEQIADGVYADRYSFLVAMKEMLTRNYSKKPLPESAKAADDEVRVTVNQLLADI